jgi:RND superfamily putative drug exporter
VDAIVIRLVLVPAAMQLLGEWNWWTPAWLDHLLPRLELEEQIPSPMRGGQGRG